VLADSETRKQSANAPQPVVDPRPVTVSTEHRPSIVASLTELWRYRELACFFAWRDIKVRYKQAALGAGWAILQPLLSMIVFTLFFGRLAGIPSDGVPYPVFAYVGLAVWTYFSGVVIQAGQGLVSNSNLITKVYFPRLTLPFSTALSGLLDFAVSLSFLGVLLAYFRIVPGYSLILAPMFLLALILLTLGVSLWLAALNVWYRDVKHVTPLLVQLWMFVTPVIYPMSFVPDRFRHYIALNPVAGIVDGLRRCLVMGTWPDPLLTLSALAITGFIFWSGLGNFRNTERSFADVI